MISERMVKAAMALRAEAPQGWDEFVMSMREHAATQTAEFLRCAPEMLTRAQGMAIAANEIATSLANAPALYDKLQGQKDGRPQNRN
jgi:hypothetical protein